MTLSKGLITAACLIFLILPGFIFSLQGANVIISSSSMTGDPLWIVIGVAMMLAGGAVLYFVNRKRPT
jgi:LPXTG-motif cell wall-anchored protein